MNSNLIYRLVVVCFALVLQSIVRPATSGAADDVPKFSHDILPIFTKYCVGCHNEADLEGGLSMESFATLQEGGDQGAAVLAGQADSSRLIRMMTGVVSPAMPPEDMPQPGAAEIELIRRWIEAGGLGPDGTEPPRQLLTPSLAPSDDVTLPVTALALAPNRDALLLGHFGKIARVHSIFRSRSNLPLKFPGKVNSIFTQPGSDSLVVASGIAGLYGEATLIDTTTWETVSKFRGHRDTLYDAVLSPDGRLLATCSYDQEVLLWDVDQEKVLQRITGHNGPVFDLAFSPDGRVLASASGDETVKLWRVKDGQRLDTLGQPEAEQYVVRFSPDGKQVVAGGADNRVRVWRLVSIESPAINPLLYARFAHESSIVGLAFDEQGRWLFSADQEGALKQWKAGNYQEVKLFEPLTDAISGLVVAPDGNTVTAATHDGRLHFLKAAPYVSNTETGKGDAKEATEATAVAADQQINQVAEREPNNRPTKANAISLPATIRGTIEGRHEERADEDLFRFTARLGEEWVFEVKAARDDSQLDSIVEVVDAEGKSIERVILQAVRDSYFTFRGKDSETNDDFRVHNWEEMKLNQFLYAGGEVVKLWHYPRGPDSGFMVYPGRASRYGYFDTTPLSHALGDPCYIVEPHSPEEDLIPTGLPLFPIYYENDDDAKRELGRDSRLTFTAPRDGEFLVRIRDVRGFEGEGYTYELIARPRTPDFQVDLETKKLTLLRGSRGEFRVAAQRYDDYEGPILVHVDGAPAGVEVTSPVTIQAGQIVGYGVITVDENAGEDVAQALEKLTLRAVAAPRGEPVTKVVAGFEEIKFKDSPELLVHILGSSADERTLYTSASEKSAEKELEANTKPTAAPIAELTIAPGETISAVVLLERNGFDGEVSFGKADAGRNLPHGVYVDNIGLNGLTILKGQSSRQFFITADDWVPEQSRLFHLQANVAGNPTSQPVMLHVRRGAKQANR